MKKFLILLYIAVIFVAVSIVIAFFVVDINAHKSYEYIILKNDIEIGKSRVDVYSTEGRIIYKGETEYRDPYLYPTTSEKYTLRKNNFNPIKYVQETEGVRGQKRLVVMEKNGEYLDYLYLNHPDFVAKKDIQIKDSSMFFSPDSLVTYFSLIEVYSFWKKGTQFMDLLIPFDNAIVPMEDMLEMKFGPFEYVQVEGKKMEADSLIISTDGMKNIVLYVSKYSHKLLMIEYKDIGEKVILVKSDDSLEKRINPVFEKAFKIIKRLVLSDKEMHEEDLLPENASVLEEKVLLNKEKGEEVFFESENNVFSGRIWRTKEEEKAPVVVFLPEDGPMSGIQDKFINALGGMFSDNGVSFFTFDVSGQGKSQGASTAKEDEKRIKDIISAINFVKTEKGVDPKFVHIAGYRGGAFLALKAALETKEIASCILLDPPLLELNQKVDIEAVSKKNLKTTISGYLLGPFDKRSVKKWAGDYKSYIDYIINGQDEFLFFSGMKLSLVAYRDYLSRNIVTLIEKGKDECPFLIIWSGESEYVTLESMPETKKYIEANKGAKVAVIGKPMETFGSVKYSKNGLNFEVDDEVDGMLKDWVAQNSIKNEVLENESVSNEQIQENEKEEKIVIAN